MIKAIMFGLWETLGTKHFSVSKLLREHFGIEDTSDFLEKYEKSMQLKEWDSQEEMARSFLETFNIEINNENVDFIVGQIKRGIDEATLFNGMEDVLRNLKRRYKLAILSNTTNFEAKVVSKWDIEELFNKQLYSWKIKSLKPSHRNFNEICNQLDAQPNECIFIDNEERSTKVAVGIGFKVIKFKNVDNLKMELTAFGISI